jgi:hypothetical protein
MIISIIDVPRRNLGPYVSDSFRIVAPNDSNYLDYDGYGEQHSIFNSGKRRELIDNYYYHHVEIHTPA